MFAADQTFNPFANVRFIAPERSDPSLSITDEEEPGEWIVIRGLVTDGLTHVRGVSIFVYHADWMGRYTVDEMRLGARTKPRLHGAMRTDTNGRYCFDTIRPGPYPHQPLPAQIHWVVTAPGFKDLKIQMWFADDPMISSEKRAEAANDAAHDGEQVVILPMARDARGVWHSLFDITLTRIERSGI